jgi:dCMP deaminase
MIDSGKRKDYLSWSDYFMGVAALSAMRSKDPDTQVGACIVNNERHIVGIGYNGFPCGCTDEQLPWTRKGNSPLDTKYSYVVHAELNAILNANSSVKDCSLYTTLFPCNECAKLIIQAGINRVVYLRETLREEHRNSLLAAKKLLDLACVKYTKYEPNNQEISIKFNKY